MKTETTSKILKAIPNTCTLLNAVCGLLAMMLSLLYQNMETVKIACIFIVVGGFFDSIDGRLARKLNVVTPMGKELDSFADLISFGITPMCVFLVLHSVGNNHPVSLIEIIISAFYICCAMFRLARYNVSDHSDYFLGLPTTASGMFMSLYIIISSNCSEFWTKHLSYSYISYGIIILLGVAMVSNVKVNRI